MLSAGKLYRRLIALPLALAGKLLPAMPTQAELDELIAEVTGER